MVHVQDEVCCLTEHSCDCTIQCRNLLVQRSRRASCGEAEDWMVGMRLHAVSTITSFAAIEIQFLVLVIANRTEDAETALRAGQSSPPRDDLVLLELSDQPSACHGHKHLD